MSHPAQTNTKNTVAAAYVGWFDMRYATKKVSIKKMYTLITHVYLIKRTKSEAVILESL